MIISHQLTQPLFTVFHQSTILLSNSFDEGLNKDPWGGGDWNEYVRGKNVREWNERIASESENSHKPPSGGWDKGPGNGPGAGDGGCIGIIILLVLALLVLIPSAVAALFGSLLLILSIAITKGTLPKLPFKIAYTASFFSIVVYLLTASVLAFIQTSFFPILNEYGHPRGFRMTYEDDQLLGMFKFFNFLDGQNPVGFKHLLIFHLPCLLLSAIPLTKKIYSVFYGFAGYGRAVLTSLFTMLPSIIITMHIAGYILLKYWQ